MTDDTDEYVEIRREWIPYAAKAGYVRQGLRQTNVQGTWKVIRQAAGAGYGIWQAKTRDYR